MFIEFISLYSLFLDKFNTSVLGSSFVGGVIGERSTLSHTISGQAIGGDTHLFAYHVILEHYLIAGHEVRLGVCALCGVASRIT